MKTTSLKTLFSCAALTIINSASATVITIPTNGASVSPNSMSVNGSSTWSFSTNLLAVTDVAKVDITNFGVVYPAVVVKDAEGFYAEASITASMANFQADTVSGQILSTTSIKDEGALMTAPVVKKVSTGGSLSVSELNVDLVNRKVYATLIGANGVGTLNNFYLWDVASITGNTTFAGPGSYNTQISGLTITGEGFNVFAKSLGLLTTGKNALAGVTDYGNIQSTIYARPVLVTEPHPWNWEPTGSVPEPSTYMYTMMGLAVMGLALRRQAK